MNDSRALWVETGRATARGRARGVRRHARSHMIWAASLACLLAAAGCDRSRPADGAKVSSALVEDTPTGQRAIADEFLAQVARRQQLAAAHREMAAKQAAAEVVLTTGTSPTRNARLKTELESLAAAVEGRIVEAQAAADFHLELARALEGPPDAGGVAGAGGGSGGAGGRGGRL